MSKIQIKIFLYICAIFLLESALVKVYSPTRLLPQLLFILSVTIAIRRPAVEGLWFSFFAGLLLEIFSGQFFGAYIFVLVVNWGVVFFTTRKITSQDISVASGALMVAISTLLAVIILYLYSLICSFLRLGDRLAFESLWSFGIFWLIVFNLASFHIMQFIYNILLRNDEKPF
ncbi:MAG: hypothetical protein Q8R08_00375 [bacterium]|nr:hypothetical protein [bacterium]